MSNQKNDQESCCRKYHDGNFPTLPVVILAIGVIWLLNDLDVVTINIPWLPVVLIIVAIGLIVNRYARKA